jgi:biopolymer transport protein TolR
VSKAAWPKKRRLIKVNPEKRAPRAVPYVNVTPLIDVLLVLLIIFMVVTPLKPSRFKALIPEPPAPDLDVVPSELALVVTIERDLTLKLNQTEDMGTTGETGKLSVALSEAFRRRTEAHTYSPEMANRFELPEGERVLKTVFIKAPRSIPYGEVAKVIDGIKSAGAKPIGLQIDGLN